MYQNVLIPTDGSDGTRRSIVHGLTIAERFGARVHALSVVPEGPLGTLESEEATPAAHRAVEHVESEARRAGLEVATAVDHGVPHEEILAYAEAESIDVIVMGTQGRTGLDRVLVGSVTERVVRMADVPVVTVRLIDDVRIEESAEAERLAREALSDARTEYDPDAPIADGPHRISATWIVLFETEAGIVRVTVDAASGETRLENGE
ncbi:universal stress protein [Natrarchaeobius oligotrophus]|uniref:Universal stress protein n=1 Tax=Natrarchaeobius chitinivorans TaxID=1679083 RepID=A0A3N6MY18_NATCH|nr:universal stress protein [Natrarchaeobius chitinivorans]RQG99956.1 universal stress protein [Natrarchaeobius chitinivorans]